MQHQDAILIKLQNKTKDNPITGTELRRRLEFAGFKFTNSQIFYNTLAELKKLKLIGGGMINKKRCYWSLKPEIVHIQDVNLESENILDILDGLAKNPDDTLQRLQALNKGQGTTSHGETISLTGRYSSTENDLHSRINP